MAITADDLIAPNGPIEVTLFPGEDVEGEIGGSTILKDRLNIYIAQASAKNAGISFPDEDAADTAWALHLAFEAAYMVAVARPSTDNAQVAVLGSETYSKDQRDALLIKANEYLDEYLALLAEVPTTSAQKGVPTRSTTNEFAW
jgi:hypothetical protein